MSTEPSAPGPTTVPIETIRHTPLKANAGETIYYECLTGTETIESPASSSSDTVDPVGRDSADMPPGHCKPTQRPFKNISKRSKSAEAYSTILVTSMVW